VALAEDLRGAVPASEAIGGQNAGGEVVTVRSNAIVETMRYLRTSIAEPFDMLVDITAVDRIEGAGELEVVYQLCRLADCGRLTVKTAVPAANPKLASLTSIWKAANWAEREVYDMFGVVFEGHPDLRRILLYEQFEGHPLRKAYPYQKRQPLVPERDPIADPWPARDLEPR